MAMKLNVTIDSAESLMCDMTPMERTRFAFDALQYALQEDQQQAEFELSQLIYLECPDVARSMMQIADEVIRCYMACVEK